MSTSGTIGTGICTETDRCYRSICTRCNPSHIGGPGLGSPAFTFIQSHMGWQCPRCSTVWAPSVQSCSKCSSPTQYVIYGGLGGCYASGPTTPATKTEGKK